jgi:hypothetical protein
VVSGGIPWPCGTALQASIAGRRVAGELLMHRGDLADRLLTLRTAAGELLDVPASLCRPVAPLPERDPQGAGARREPAPAAGGAERGRA